MKYLLISLMLFYAPCYADFSQNLRWSLDASARLNHNESIDNTSRIYALGLDAHKVLVSLLEILATGLGNFITLSCQIICPYLFYLTQRMMATLLFVKHTLIILIHQVGFPTLDLAILQCFLV